MTELLTPLESQLATPEALRNEVPFEGLHKSEYFLDTSGASIYEPVDIGLPGNGEYTVLAELQIGEKEEVGSVAVIKQNNNGNDSLMLAGLVRDINDPDGHLKVNGSVLELRDGFSVELGRAPENTGDTKEVDAFLGGLHLGSDTDISRKHARISYERGIVTIADTSTNGSKIRAHGKYGDGESHEREHTFFAEDQARLKGYLLETLEGKRYDGRITVGRDTTIDGADAYVDIRSWVAGGEAIVVDSKKYPEEFNNLITNYNNAVSELARRGIGGEKAKLQAIFDTVSASMKYDLAFVNAQSEEIKDNAKRKVSLNYYLSEEKGVCRHMALAVAWLGGELARHGVIEGTTTAEVNQRKKDNAAHEWARYTSKDGTVYILDPAQKYFGTLEDSLSKNNSWEYFRPGERMKYEVLEQKKAAESGDMAVSGIAKLFGHLRKK